MSKAMPRRLMISALIGMLGISAVHTSSAAVKTTPEVFSDRLSLDAGLRPIWTPPSAKVASNDSDIQDIVRGALNEKPANYLY